MNLDDTELENLLDGFDFITIGNPASGDITLLTTIFRDNLSLVTGGDIVSSDGVAITSASVLRSGNGWEAFYVGYDRPISQRAPDDEPLWMGRAFSDDGLHWTKDPENPIFQTTQRIWPLTFVLPDANGYVFLQDTAGGRQGISRFVAHRPTGRSR